MEEVGVRVRNDGFFFSSRRRHTRLRRDWSSDVCSSDLDDLIPPFDIALEALVNDLQATGQFDETLIVVTGEFGRTPRVTLKTAGREHWSSCFSAMLLGGGIRGGQVYGSSDKIGGFPASNPVSPADLTATIYHCLGIDPHTEIHDQFNRPMWLSEGKPIEALI